MRCALDHISLFGSLVYGYIVKLARLENQIAKNYEC